MGKINFIKMVASGNDFVIIELKIKNSKLKNLRDLAKNICDRKYGVGADGLLLLEKTKKADIKMRIFNADGSEAAMCGNGARCVAFWLSARRKTQDAKRTIETKAGIIESTVSKDKVKIKLTEPKDLKLDIPIKINSRQLKVNLINTGVPHAVIFAQGLDKIDAVNLGRQIRFYKRFAPKGTNVDFVEFLNENSLKIRTYERGVEDETLACGTGSVAAALISVMRYALSTIRKINIYTRSGEILRVYFKRDKDKFSDVWLEGKAKIVHKGEYYV